MTHFEEPFASQDIDQQLEQLLSNPSIDRSKAQLLADLQTLHQMAAGTEKRSIASAWERIEAGHTQRKEAFKKRPLRLYNNMNKTVIPLQFAPRAQKRRGLYSLVAILAVFLLVGGFVLLLVQGKIAATDSRPRTIPGSVTPFPTATSTTDNQQNKTTTVVYTNAESDGGEMVLAWSPDSKRILRAGTDVAIWDATTGQHRVVYHPLTSAIPVQNAAWAPDNSQRVAIADGTTVRIINANTGAILMSGPKSSSASLPTRHSANPLSQGTASIRALAWSPDGNEIASSVSLISPVLTSRAIVIWNSHTGVVIKQLLGHIDDVYAVAWSPDGKYLASLAQSQDNTVRLWNVATGQQLYAVRPAGYGAMERLAWSPNGQYLAVQMQVQVGNNTLGAIVTRDEIQVWRALTHQIVTTFPSPSAGDGFNGFSWAPDSRRIVTAIGSSGAQDNEVLIWNATTGQNLYIFQGTYPEGVAWSPDGKYIVQAAWQYTSSGQAVSITEVWLAPAGTPG